MSIRNVKDEQREFSEVTHAPLFFAFVPYIQLVVFSFLPLMSFPSDTSPWAAPEADVPQEITVETALEKERVIKDIVTLRDGLRGLLVRITEVEGDNDKLKRENEMLAIYMENL